MNLTHRDKAYLIYIRTLPCTYCTVPDSDSYHTVAHHESIGDTGGYGLKASDYFTLPLCMSCHVAVHLSGRESFWEGFDVKRIIIDLLSNYISTRS